jgi:hypothetical protein
VFWQQVSSLLYSIRETFEEKDRDTTDAKIVKQELGNIVSGQLYLLSVEQAEVFQSAVRFPMESFPPLPFPSLFIEFNGWLRFHYEGGIQGHDGMCDPNNKSAYHNSGADHAYRGVLIHANESAIGATWYARPDAEFIAFRIVIFKDDWPNPHIPSAADKNTGEHYERLFRMTVNLLYFLSCENVALVRVTEQAWSRHAKALRGLPRPIKPYYTVPMMVPRYRLPNASDSAGAGGPHRYKYDVKGSMRWLRSERFHRNEDGSIRVVWVHPHQRGVGSGVYVPSIRVGKIGARLLEYDEFISELERRKA